MSVDKCCDLNSVTTVQDARLKKLYRCVVAIKTKADMVRARAPEVEGVGSREGASGSLNPRLCSSLA